MRRSSSTVVVDLPGFGDTHQTQEQILTEVSRCVVLTAPGPHAFLLVVPLGRYTEEDNMAATLMARMCLVKRRSATTRWCCSPVEMTWRSL